MDKRDAAEEMLRGHRLRVEAYHKSYKVYEEFLDSLGEEQLVGLGTFMDMLFNASNVENNLAWWSGIVVSRLFERHQRCMVCQRHHEQEAAEMMTMSPQQLMEKFEVRPFGPHESVLCIHCNEQYASLAVRIATDPGPAGCRGCVGERFIKFEGHNHD